MNKCDTFLGRTFFAILLVIVAVVFSGTQARAEFPELVWVDAVGAATDPQNYGDEGRSVALDASGNIYMTGRFFGAADLDPTAGTDMHTANAVSTFITKLNADGSYAWSVSFTDQPGLNEPMAIAIDQAGWPVVAGRCRDTVDFDAGTGEHIVSPGTSNFGYLVKYAPNGVFDWALTWDLNANWINDLAISSAGDIYITGGFQLSTDFDLSGALDVHTSNGEEDVFITKVYNNGDYAWTRTFGSNGWDSGSGIAVGSDGVVVIGIFTNTVDFDAGGGQELHSSNGGYDMFITKYDLNGFHWWTRTFGAADSNEGIRDVVLDSQRNVIATGYFCSATDFDGTGGVDTKSPYGGQGCDAFITKYNYAGAYKWTRPHGDGEAGSSTEDGFGLAVDSADNIYMTGVMDTSGGRNNILVAKYSKDNVFQWFFNAGSVSDISVGKSIVVDTSGDFLLTGYFYGTAFFAPMAGASSKTAAGETDSFLARYKITNAVPPGSESSSGFWLMTLPATLRGARNP